MNQTHMYITHRTILQLHRIHTIYTQFYRMYLHIYTGTIFQHLLSSSYYNPTLQQELVNLSHC